MTDKYTIPSDTEALRRMLPVLLATIRTTHPTVSDTDYMDLRLIFTELIVNAIVHGNRWDGQKQVQVTVYYNPCGLLSVIADEGAGFDYAAVFLYENNDRNQWSESGRGLLLVRSLTDWLAFSPKGNEIAFFKKIIRLPSTYA